MREMAHTILIVDDSESVRNIFSMSLQITGNTIREAADGEEAYKIIRETDVDLVITDIAMPKMSGTELLKKIRTELRNPTLPVIICTAERKADAKQLLQSGANDVLEKPIIPSKLLKKVKALLDPTG